MTAAPPNKPSYSGGAIKTLPLAVPKSRYSLRVELFNPRFLKAIGGLLLTRPDLADLRKII